MSVSKSKMQIENKKENNENLDVDVIEEKKEEFEKLIEGKEPAKIKENEEETLENNETIAVEENEVNNDPIKELETGEDNSANNDEYLVVKDEDKKRNPLIYVLVAIFSIIIIFLSVVVCYNIFYKKIFSNIDIAGIDVSNLTKEEAINKLNGELENVLNQEILIQYDGKQSKIKPSDLGVEYNVEDVVEEAYRIGRIGNIFENNINMLKTFFVDTSLDLSYEYEEEKLDNFINEINSQFSSLVPSSYEILEDKIVIKKGTRGIEIKADELKESLLESINSRTFEPIQVGVVISEPAAIDIEKIHDEVYKAPVDAYYTTDPFEVHESEDGLDFDISLDEAKALLETDQEQYEIKLKVLKPAITTDQIGNEAFPDLLATCTTTYITSKVGRTTNLKLASSKINGYVLMPGETFSYNDVVGERTVEAGFQMAGVYSNGQEVDGLGGGICQISSTLYNAALLANLEIVERRNHQFVTSYVPAGRDATVVYGTTDFKFKNTRKYPIRIVATANAGIATISIYGIKEENEYTFKFSTKTISTIPYSTQYVDDSTLPTGTEVVKQKGANGLITETYITKILNGKTISTELLSRDTYSAMTRIVRRGTGVTAATNSQTQEQTIETTPIEPEQTETPIVEQPETETEQTTDGTEVPAA